MRDGERVRVRVGEARVRVREVEGVRVPVTLDVELREAVALDEGVPVAVRDGVAATRPAGWQGSATPPDEYAAGTVDWP